jgi:hypothetical protein
MSTVYVPGGTGAMLKKPADEESLTVLTPVALFVIVMVAWATTAPVESVTVPSREPSPAVCAGAGIAVQSKHSANAKSANAKLAQTPMHCLSVANALLNVFREFMGKASFK